MKILKWLVILFFSLIVLAGLVLGMGSYFSLDHNFAHSKATQQLPEISTVSSGLVRIPTANGDYRARVAGLDQDADTIILLHGFPVTSAMWEPAIEPLAEAGFRVIAFDQRGYSPGVRPREATAYTINHLISDVLLVADVVGAHRFHLVGHDWGAAVGWNTVLTHPDRILSWTGMSIAHPKAFSDALLEDPDQQSRSRYFAFFTTPMVPEIAFTFSGMNLMQQMYAPMPQAARDEYVSVFSEPGALTAVLNWYRQMGAALPTPGDSSSSQSSLLVKTPTLFIWGNNDPSAGRAAVEAQSAYIRAPYEFIELDGHHWLMETHAQTIVPALVNHIHRFSQLHQ